MKSRRFVLGSLAATLGVCAALGVLAQGKTPAAPPATPPAANPPLKQLGRWHHNPNAVTTPGAHRWQKGMAVKSNPGARTASHVGDGVGQHVNGQRPERLWKLRGALRDLEHARNSLETAGRDFNGDTGRAVTIIDQAINEVNLNIAADNPGTTTPGTTLPKTVPNPAPGSVPAARPTPAPAPNPPKKKP